MSMLVNPYAFGGATGSSIVAGSAPTSDQWRLSFPLGDTGAGFLNINEVEMRASSGGADQCTGGTASSTSAPTFGPDRAFDNNPTSAWSPTTADGSWLQYTFAAAVSVIEFTVKGDANSGPEKIILQYYNGSSWVDAYTSGTLSWVNGEIKTFTITAPTYTVAPSISYSFLAVGDTLTGNVGTYSNAEIVTYQWKRNGSAIGGATSTTYTLVSADIGAQITFAVYIENGAGAYTGTSASVGPVISAASFATQSVEFSDTSTVTLSDSSTLEMYNRTA